MLFRSMQSRPKWRLFCVRFLEPAEPFGEPVESKKRYHRGSDGNALAGKPRVTSRAPNDGKNERRDGDLATFDAQIKKNEGRADAANGSNAKIAQDARKAQSVDQPKGKS